MQIAEGAYNTAKIFTDVIEPAAMQQVLDMCNSPVFASSRIRIMPDVHAGKGCTVGTTMTITDRAVPNMVGVDIGCGMQLSQLSARSINFSALDCFIRANIPSGTARRSIPHAYAARADLEGLRCLSHINVQTALLSVGTLGGGNHFIEVDRDEDGRLYLVVHSGSRHLGVEVAGYYQAEAYRRLCGNSASQRNELIARLKAEGRQREISSALAALGSAEAPVPADSAWAEGELFADYLHDMRLVQEYAAINRLAIVDDILRGMGLEEADGFTTVHNYIDTDAMILRKGAVSARTGERLLIPINMRFGSLICEGLGNEDWNFSAPHGAGRLLSRGNAARTLSLEEYRRQMRGVFTTSVGEATLDESPMAYKRPEDIISNISPTARVVRRIEPVYNFKTG